MRIHTSPTRTCTFNDFVGLVSCWVVMFAYARGVRSYGMPMGFAIMCTVMHVPQYAGMLSTVLLR
jgi:hypothetical protein